MYCMVGSNPHLFSFSRSFDSDSADTVSLSSEKVRLGYILWIHIYYFEYLCLTFGHDIKFLPAKGLSKDAKRCLCPIAFTYTT